VAACGLSWSAGAPDGYIVEAIQVPPAADAPAGNVLGSIMGLTVRDMDESMRFWRDQLGWSFTGDRAFVRAPAMLDLMGLPAGSEFRAVSGVVPGSRARMEISEFKGMLLKCEGVRVVSKDGELVLWSATLRNVFVKDPNGLNVELVGESWR
jgi:catechol 2,3-dioxygenase-like lactoylglutathione lyase family enzyme